MEIKNVLFFRNEDKIEHFVKIFIKCMGFDKTIGSSFDMVAFFLHTLHGIFQGLILGAAVLQFCKFCSSYSC